MTSIMRSNGFRDGQRGVGMVEVMVAMLLGAMVIVGVTQLFTANRQTFRMQDAMAVAQEGGTFAVDFIAQDAMRAGFLALDFAADGDFSDLDNVAFDWVNTVDGGPGNNDSLAVVYQLDATLMPNLTTFCTGNAVDFSSPPVWISNRFWVDVDGNLMCQGANVANNGITSAEAGDPQVLVSNVESFQVLFGVNLDYTACPASLIGRPTAYVTADLVEAAIDKAQAACPDQIAATVVRTVRIALLLRTENPAGAINADGQVYTVLDQTFDSDDLTLDDGRLRRLFTRTVLLRNNGDEG